MARCLECYLHLKSSRTDCVFCSGRCRTAYHRSRKQPSVPAGKIILSLCDYTGNWCKPYRDAGYTVLQHDLKHGIDIRLLEMPRLPVHGILAAPPCTVFASSGARWTRSDAEMLEGLSIVDACLRMVAMLQPDFWALENPVGKLSHYLGKPAWIFNPCDYGRYPKGSGDSYTKKTCLWGKFNRPKPLPVPPTDGSKMHRCYGGNSVRTKTLRSATPMGFAEAFFFYNP
jgi:hypothetical protein